MNDFNAGRLLPAAARPAARRVLVRYRQRGLRTGDAVLVSYPKSGSTWLRFLLAHVLTGEEADYGSIRRVIPPLGQHKPAKRVLPNGGRLLRSHEPLSTSGPLRRLPVVYLMRDPRDVCLSYFNHRRRQGYTGDVQDFARRFLAGAVDGYGSWSDHVDAATSLQASGRSRFLLLRYEDLRADPACKLAQVLEFLGVEGDQLAITAALAANTRSRMRAKEDSSFLHRVGMDGNEQAPETRSWTELIPPDLDRAFSAVAAGRLERCGYGQSLDVRRNRGTSP